MPQPLEVNEMRTFKPEKYSSIREIISASKGLGGLKYIADNLETLKMS